MSHSRSKNLSQAKIIKGQLCASGSFKNVWQGKYVNGKRRGQKCVFKEFINGSTIEAHYFEKQLRIIKHAQRIIDAFEPAEIIPYDILLSIPEIRTFNGTKSPVLVEPMIDNYHKFNSNTGWVSDRGERWSEAMQALSHHSYHKSNRQYLLCDLQGGVSIENGYVLSDPVIISKTANSMGPGDLGDIGIANFFHYHKCNQFCGKNWKMPFFDYPKPMFDAREGTMMLEEGTLMGGSETPLLLLESVPTYGERMPRLLLDSVPTHGAKNPRTRKREDSDDEGDSHQHKRRR